MNKDLPTPPFTDKVNTIVPLLPMDVQTQIYREHLQFEVEKKPICDKLLDWFLHSKEANRLHVTPYVLETMESLLTCKTSMKYLCDHDTEINKCYEDHYIRNNKNFDLMDPLNSFILSILMYKYH